MLVKSLFFLPAWQKNKRDPHYFTVNSIAFIDFFYCPSRCGHNAVCVNEDLIIWGGYSEPETGRSLYCEKDAIWAYNLDNDFWCSVSTEGEAPKYRSGAVSVLCWPNWYIIGGHTHLGNVSDIYALNLITLQWSSISTSHPGLSRRDKASAWIWENRVYVFGGYGPTPKSDLWDEDAGDRFTMESDAFRGWNNQVVCLDLETKEWKRPYSEGKQPLPRAAHSSTLVGNCVYIFGGRHRSQRLNDLHCLDLESGKWKDNIVCLGEIPCGRSWHTMSRSDSSHLLLVGGYNNENVTLDDVWLLNIQTYSWQLMNRKTGHPRLWHTANVNYHGDILVFGGCLSEITNDEVQLETSSKVVLFKTHPFSLQRMCLHSLFNNRQKTEDLWDVLPRDMREWLHNRCQFFLDMSPDYFEHTAELGFGPSLSNLSVMSLQEANRLNDERKDLDLDE